MPKDTSIKKTLVIGSGPIVIGQAAEFDYSGTQACEILKSQGIETVLVNSNPATIMTDKEMADSVYIEPLSLDYLVKIIEKERPDSLLGTVGGQTGLNLTVQLYQEGVLDKYGIKILGTPIEAIEKGEDRDLFKECMAEIGQPTVESKIVHSMEEGLEVADEMGYPLVLRPAYTLGGSGGGICENEEEFIETLRHGLNLSQVHEVLLEKSIKGWKEIEFEVIRDKAGNKISVCSMENVDPVGVHTGDSIVCAPCQTLSSEEISMLRRVSLDIVEAVGVEGGCNVQIALNPKTSDYDIIEINPRLSRSSALASKATGYPIARVTTMIALGYNLDEIENALVEEESAVFEPSIDYVVVKIPKWPFDKFKNADRKLGTKMMATGEVMAIGQSFEQALLKAIRSLEISQYSLEHEASKERTIGDLKKRIQMPDDERLFDLAELIRRGYSISRLESLTGINKWFLDKLKWIIDQEEELKRLSIEDLTKDYLLSLKRKGFSDRAIAEFIGVEEKSIKHLRDLYSIKPSYKKVDTCAGVYEAKSPYFYSSYDDFNESLPSSKKKVIVIGSGPIRIGQGIEFDYCSVQSVKALKKMGIETIIINNNPETVSTDFDVSDKLYFEPLTEEDVLEIVELEKPFGVILQFGGQTAIKLAKALDMEGVNILGTDYQDIDRAEDREKFEEVLEELGINRPKGRGVWTLEEGVQVAEKLGYPVLVRPSYVLGGRGMEITYNEKSLRQYLSEAFRNDAENPVLIDKYLSGKEIEVDAISDGQDILIPGIMEHLERAGVHSGDSITVYPSMSISEEIKEKILSYTKSLAEKLKVKGMMNIQFIEYQAKLYIIEVNPRASRTVPYVTKASGVPIIELATRCMLGEKLENLGYGRGIYKTPDHIFCKVPVLSMSKLKEAEVSLGPEMKSTGEVLGVGESVEEALYKGFLAAGYHSQENDNKKVLATINDKDKGEFIEIAKDMKDQGYEFYATEGTAKSLEDAGIEAHRVKKLSQSDDIIDLISQGKVSAVIDTPTKGNISEREGFKMRRMATEYDTDIYTSLDTLKAKVKSQTGYVDKSMLKVYDMNDL